jgi:hypothetical protein
LYFRGDETGEEEEIGGREERVGEVREGGGELSASWSTKNSVLRERS